MSGKLDQPLDEIISTQRRVAGGRRRTQRRPAGRIATAAPVGGVKKTTKQSAAIPKQAPAKAKATGGNGDSKVVVSNLPKDVTESQIKEYFQSSVGFVKRVEVSYGPGGQSRGMATVTFGKLDGANKAYTALNGLLVDNRPIKIEIIVSAAKAAAIVPPSKTLTERISQPKGQAKAQPKSAAANKKKEAAAGKGGAPAAKQGRKRAPRNSRPTKKTAEELDSEMADYFVPSNQNENTNGGAPAAANGDAAMDDGIL